MHFCSLLKRFPFVWQWIIFDVIWSAPFDWWEWECENDMKNKRCVSASVCVTVGGELSEARIQYKSPKVEYGAAGRL